MKNNEQVKYLKNYLERKREELKKEECSLEEVKKEREDCMNTKAEIENKIKELELKKEFSERDVAHVESLRNALSTYEIDILRLTGDIVSHEEMIEDLNYDIEMTEEEMKAEIDE